MATLTPYEDDRAWRGSLICSVCGYGIARETPPGPCPMCRADDAWVQPSWLSSGFGSTASGGRAHTGVT
jgi:hypothetical protein